MTCCVTAAAAAAEANDETLRLPSAHYRKRNRNEPLTSKEITFSFLLYDKH
jgi:hypothetical protein